ncbi:MAG: hypothetical protein KQH79_12070 [Bacteroidetes bacterium]|nr:hypothetical protein [Bacteroidota bacterium]
MGKYLTILLFLLITPNLLIAQDNDALHELKSAYLNIQNENYQEAYPYYRKMLDQYPKEPIYHYYVGRCLLFIDKDPLKAIKYLRFASTKDVPVDVYYYLGRAYIKNYRFQKALETLQIFEKNASKKELRNLQYEVYLSMAQNGLYLTKYIREPLVYSKQVFDLDDFYKIYSFEDLEGSFIKQDDFFENDSTKTNAVIFVPGSLQNQGVVYFTKRNEKRGDLDIYSITRLSDSTWSEPENLGEVINTPFDESYPFMHSDGTTLYFASKGHYSMGGYDIYKSTWDWNTQQWSEPENLDFPVNSPYNDFLFVPTPNKKIAFFASDRDTDFNQIMVYKLKLTSSEPYIELHSYQDIRKYAKLNVNSDVDEQSGKQSGNEYKSSEKNLIKIKNNTDFQYKSEYDSLLNLAINYQLTADSLRWIIDDKRSVFENTSDGQERASLSNIIIELEREIYSLQKKADNCYKRVREIEQINLATEKSIYEDNKKVEPRESGTTNRTAKIFVEPTIDSLTKSKLSIPDKELDEEHFMETGLEIESPSEYTKENPIPLNETMPDGIMYMIQLGAFSSEKSPVVFKGLSPLSCIKKEGSSIRKYFAGKFLQLAEAEKALPKVRSKGFKDAYIVAFNSGNIISVKKAVSMESKEDRIPMATIQKEESQKTDKQENLSIIYVLKGQMEKNDSIHIEKIKDELKDDEELYLESKEKFISFIIKSFSSYDSALPVKYKLEAILQKDVEIHAYFAENQIPLEQARKITK